MESIYEQRVKDNEYAFFEVLNIEELWKHILSFSIGRRGKTIKMVIYLRVNQ